MDCRTRDLIFGDVLSGEFYPAQCLTIWKTYGDFFNNQIPNIVLLNRRCTPSYTFNERSGTQPMK